MYKFDCKTSALFTDFYELTMSQVNFDNNEQNDIAYFDGFFRREPLDAGYGLICGTDSMIEYIQNLHFTDSDIDYFNYFFVKLYCYFSCYYQLSSC